MCTYIFVKIFLPPCSHQSNVRHFVVHLEDSHGGLHCSDTTVVLRLCVCMYTCVRVKNKNSSVFSTQQQSSPCFFIALITSVQGVTELIKLNIGLNFPENSRTPSSPSPSPSPSTALNQPSPPPPCPPETLDTTSTVPVPRSRLRPPSSVATSTPADTANAAQFLPTAVPEAPEAPDAECSDSQRVVASPAASASGVTGVLLPWQRSQAVVPPVTCAPLVWGEEPSEDVARFGADVIVMSDVVYDPAGRHGVGEGGS